MMKGISFSDLRWWHLTLLVIVGCAGWMLWKHWRMTRRQTDEPPIVTEGLPWLGVGLDFRRDPVKLLKRLHKKHGDVFTCILGGSRMTFITNAHDGTALIKQSGPGRDLDFEPKSKEIAKKVFGHDIERSVRMHHVDMNHLSRIHMTGLMNPDGLQQLTSRMCQTMVSELYQKIPLLEQKWQCRPMYSFITQLVFAAASKSMFGENNDIPWDTEVYNKFMKFDRSFGDLTIFGDKCLAFLPEVAEARKYLWELLGDIPEEGNSTYMKKRKKHYTDKGLPSHDIGSAQLTVFWALHSNSLPAIFWSIAYTLNTPGLVEKVRDEVLQILCTDSPNLEESDRYTLSSLEILDMLSSLTWEHLKSMKIVDSIFTEILRLCSANFVFREAVRPTTLNLETGRISIRQGDNVVIYTPMIHFDEEIFENPYSFQWDRFLSTEDTTERKFSKHGKGIRNPIFAFGGGESMCKGRHFAVNESKIAFIATIVALDVELYHRDDINDKGYPKLGVKANCVPESKWPSVDVAAGGAGILPPIDRDSLVFRFSPK